MIVYQAVNKINGKSYIGMTTSTLVIRRRSHLSESRRGSNLVFHMALRKYGCDNFEWKVLESKVTYKDDLKQREMFYISKISPEYNMTGGGDGLLTFSQLSRDRMSKAKSGKIPWNKGKKLSPEHRKRLSESHIGNKHSKSTRGKMSALLKDRWKDRDYVEKMSDAMMGKNVGKVCSESQKIKISEKLKGNVPWNKGLKTGVGQKEFRR